ncbi:hypothetical protein T484DRAFT_1923400, partial [Baffinella frigidus]
MGDPMKGVVEWGLGLFEGVKKELDKVGASVEEGVKTVATNAGLSPSGPSPDPPDLKLHHTEQNEERRKAMARYGEYLLIRQKNAAKIAMHGEQLLARRAAGYSRDSQGTLEIFSSLEELRFKSARDEKRLLHYEEIAYDYRYTGTAKFSGDTFGQGSSRKRGASADRAGRAVVGTGDTFGSRTSSAASGGSQRSGGSRSSEKSARSSGSAKSRGSERVSDEGGGSQSRLSTPVGRAPVVDHISSGTRSLVSPPI